MSALEQAILAARDKTDDLKLTNKAYLEFIKANFIIPIEKHESDSEPVVLFLQENGDCYMPVFTDKAYLDNWACDIAFKIDVLKLSGVDLLKGVGDDVHVCLNPGINGGKVFLPAEIARMRSMVLKIFK